MSQKDCSPGMAHEFVADQVQLRNDANDVKMDAPGKQEIPELHNLIQRRRACADRKHRYRMKSTRSEAEQI